MSDFPVCWLTRLHCVCNPLFVCVCLHSVPLWRVRSLHLGLYVMTTASHWLKQSESNTAEMSPYTGQSLSLWHAGRHATSSMVMVISTFWRSLKNCILSLNNAVTSCVSECTKLSISSNIHSSFSSVLASTNCNSTEYILAAHVSSVFTR